MGRPAGRGGALQRPRGEDLDRRVRLPRARAGSHRPALGARRVVSGHAQRRQPARIRPLAGTRQEPLRAQPYPHGAPQGVPLADPYPDPDVRADRPGPGRTRHLDPGHVALQEFHRGSDHRPQDRPPEQYPTSYTASSPTGSSRSTRPSANSKSSSTSTSPTANWRRYPPKWPTSSR